jgi:peptide/nickel transport system permease protein
MGAVHWLGADHQGRDVLSRVIFGAQVSLTIGYSGVIIGGVVGIALELLAGYHGGRLDRLAIRVVDARLSFPYILIAIVWAVAIGSGVLNLVGILAVRGWVEFARVGRGQALAIRQREYITAVRAIGGGRRLSTRAADFAGSDAIISRAWRRTSHAAWESMLSDARGSLNIAWWTATFPGMAIALVVLAANFRGDRLRDRPGPGLAKQDLSRLGHPLGDHKDYPDKPVYASSSGYCGGDAPTFSTTRGYLPFATPASTASTSMICSQLSPMSKV